jgi:hypothetical protein
MSIIKNCVERNNLLKVEVQRINSHLSALRTFFQSDMKINNHVYPVQNTSIQTTSLPFHSSIGQHLNNVRKVESSCETQISTFRKDRLRYLKEIPSHYDKDLNTINIHGDHEAEIKSIERKLELKKKELIHFKAIDFQLDSNKLKKYLIEINKKDAKITNLEKENSLQAEEISILQKHLVELGDRLSFADGLLEHRDSQVSGLHEEIQILSHEKGVISATKASITLQMSRVISELTKFRIRSTRSNQEKKILALKLSKISMQFDAKNKSLFDYHKDCNLLKYKINELKSANKSKIDEFGRHLDALTKQLNYSKENSKRQKSEITELLRKNEDKNNYFKEIKQKFQETICNQRLYQIDLEKQVDAVIQDLQISRNRTRNLEDTLSNLTLEHDQTLKRLHDVNSNANHVEKIMLRMQDRESQIAVIVQKLQKARHHLEHSIKVRERELDTYVKQCTDLTYAMKKVIIQNKSLNIQLKNSERQLKSFENDLEKSSLEFIVTRKLITSVLEFKTLAIDNMKFIPNRHNYLKCVLEKKQKEVVEMSNSIAVYVGQIQKSKKNTAKWQKEAFRKNKFIEDWRSHAERLKKVLNSKEKLTSDQQLRDKEIYRQMDILRRQQEMEQERFISLTNEIANMREKASLSVEDRRLLLVQLAQTEDNLLLATDKVELSRIKIIELEKIIKHRDIILKNVRIHEKQLESDIRQTIKKTDITESRCNAISHEYLQFQAELVANKNETSNLLENYTKLQTELQQATQLVATTEMSLIEIEKEKQNIKDIAEVEKEEKSVLQKQVLHLNHTLEHLTKELADANSLQEDLNIELGKKGIMESALKKSTDENISLNHTATAMCNSVNVLQNYSRVRDSLLISVERQRDHALNRFETASHKLSMMKIIIDEFSCKQKTIEIQMIRNDELEQESISYQLELDNLKVELKRLQAQHNRDLVSMQHFVRSLRFELSQKHSKFIEKKYERKCFRGI